MKKNQKVCKDICCTCINDCKGHRVEDTCDRYKDSPFTVWNGEATAEFWNDGIFQVELYVNGVLKKIWKGKKKFNHICLVRRLEKK